MLWPGRFARLFSQFRNLADSRRSGAAIVAAQEQVILAANRHGSDHPLAEVIVDAERSILAVADQALPSRGNGGIY